ncbi:TetR/AcrR family transcriptional regulator [Nocardia farcinica]|uniref:TetR/AcrR family transcriptional regulator n=1 Tax=Nocardia farcinica TaxID=37329 RepID=UPI0018935D2C|nr:TetR/AcrR family transcriptional regulator [Nocardia farcinica]MBF6385489.1 TetR/AcrR family transcriptional regulator [Nocardia farcinica]MBF6537840.1 TetR/AcrR family transcriptional regulator [Nocardia farcinica]
MARRRGWGGSPPDSDEEATRRIVATAVDLIARTGAEISIADVAESLGVIRQTVYRYFPSAEALMKAAAIASVDGFLDRLAAHVAGLEDPVEAMTEGVVFTLTEVRRTPHLGILITGSYANVHSDGIASEEAKAFGLTMIRRFDVDWERYGYDDESLPELVEYILRTMQSFFVSPGHPPRTEDELRRYLRRWMGSAIIAQTRQPAAPRG